ncbi:MAG: hypothetical protein R3A13_10035 [Bdellovibrionota bacterium]
MSALAPLAPDLISQIRRHPKVVSLNQAIDKVVRLYNEKFMKSRSLLTLLDYGFSKSNSPVFANLSEIISFKEQRL